MTWAIATAAGKDATLALHRARAAGLAVRWSLTVVEGNTGLVRFHGTPRALVEAHARALGLEGLVAETHPRTFEGALTDLLDRLVDAGAEGVIFGNLHLADIRAWYEERVKGAGLRHLEPIWGMNPRAAVREGLELGYRAMITSVNLELADPEWLGRDLDEDLLAAADAGGLDAAGERGEYHTFVYDGPGFARPVPVRVTGRDEREGHRTLRLEARDPGE